VQENGDARTSFRISLLAYIALWLISTFSAMASVMETLKKVLEKRGLAEIHEFVIFGAVFTAAHMLFVYISFHELEVHSKAWQRGSRWVNSKCEKAVRTLIFVALLFIGGELCGVYSAVPFHDELPGHSYICRPHVSWVDIQKVQDIMEAATDVTNFGVWQQVKTKLYSIVPEETRNITPPPAVSWCVMVFLLLCLWDVFEHHRRTSNEKATEEQIGGDKVKKWLYTQWTTLAANGKYRIFVADIIGLLFWVSLAMMFVWEDYGQWLKWFLFLFMCVYASMIVYRIGKYIADGFRIVPQ
jgi:hypothetical protein